MTPIRRFSFRLPSVPGVRGLTPGYGVSESDRLAISGQRRIRMTRGLLILALAFPGCSRDLPKDEEILRPVRSQTVIATGGSRARTFSGTARAGQETDLSFRVPGRVVGQK